MVAFYITSILFLFGTDWSVTRTEPIHREDSARISHNVDRLLLSSTNSSQYTWLGNHFVPPAHIPTFLPSEYISYFLKRNTLFVGDSTGRRAYATLFALMSNGVTDQHRISTLNHYPDSAFDTSSKTVNELDNGRVIDINKRGRPQEKCRDDSRTLTHLNHSGVGEFVCRMLEKEGGAETNANGTDNSSTEIKRNEDAADKTTGKFDFLKVNCMIAEFGDILNLPPVMKNTSGVEFQEYDLIVINVGLHDAIKRCPNSMPGSKNLTHKMDMFMSSLAKISSPNAQVVMRTPGFDQKHRGDDAVWQIIDHMKEAKRRQVIEGHNSSLPDNLTVVDWGTIMAQRSHGSERITGDLMAHYGLEARLLFAQQLLHELLAEEKWRVVDA